MKIVHVAECFATGTYDFISDLTSATTDITHVIIHGIRPDTPPNYKQDFPSGTEFHEWKHASRDIDPVQDALALMSLVRLLRIVGPLDVLHLHSSKAGFLGR